LKVDKRILGLAAVSVILSTLIMLTIARERIERPVEILKNDYPSIVEEGRKSTFSFAMVARQKFENLQIRFSMMNTLNLKYAQMVDPKISFNATNQPKEVIENIVKLGWLLNETTLMELEPEKFNQTFQYQNTECRMLVYDFGNVLESVTGRDVALAAPMIYGAVIDGNGAAYYLGGESDFFFTPQENMLSLSISHNADEQNYLPDDQIWEGSKRLRLSEAPVGGVLDYGPVGKDDTFTIIFTVEPDSRYMPDGFGITGSDRPISFVQMIRIYLDGELYGEPIINVMQGKKRG